MTITKRRVLVAASGTGGHLYPARLIIEALQQEHDVEIEFVGSGRKLENTIIGPAGIPLRTITTAGIKSRGLKGIAEFLFTLPGGCLQALKIFSNFQPQVVIGVGGYATFLPVTIAWLKRIPRWIHEAERNPGLANSVLSYYSTIVSLAFPDARMPAVANTRFTGQPVRKELRRVAGEKKQIDQVKNLLILGGSQGARAIDEVMIELNEFIKESGLSVWHQCRPENQEKLQSAYSTSGIDARVMPFIDALHEAYEWSDLIVSRSGAGAVMEIGVVNRPAIFIPFPYAQGDHQTANARVLVEQEKALLVAEGDNFSSRLQKEMKNLLDPINYRQMLEKPCKLRNLDAADVIAQGALALIC